MWGHFYSRRHGWINADVNLRRMKVYLSPPVRISRINMQLIREKTGKEILNLHLPLLEVNALSKIFSNWYWYEQDIDIGCYTQL